MSKTSSVTYPGPAEAIVIEDDRLETGSVRIKRGESAKLPAALADQLREQWRQGTPVASTADAVDQTMADQAREAGEPVTAADATPNTPPAESQPGQAAAATPDTDGR